MGFVVCRLEYMPYVHTKLVLALNYIAIILSLVGMGLLMALKFADGGCAACPNVLRHLVTHTQSSPHKACRSSETTSSQWSTLWSCPSLWPCLSQRCSSMHGTSLRHAASSGADLVSRFSYTQSIHPSACRDRLRRTVVMSNIALIIAVMWTIVCSLARNAMLIGETCWWLFERDNTATIVLYSLIESGWNLTFAALVVQARLLCPPARFGSVVARMMQALRRRRTTPGNAELTSMNSPEEQPAASQRVLTAKSLPDEISSHTLPSLASTGTDQEDSQHLNNAIVGSHKAYSRMVLPDLRSTKAMANGQELSRPAATRSRWMRSNRRSKLHGASVLPMSNPGIVELTFCPSMHVAPLTHRTLNMDMYLMLHGNPQGMLSCLTMYG